MGAAFFHKEWLATISFSVAFTCFLSVIHEIREYRRYKKSIKQTEAELGQMRVRFAALDQTPKELSAPSEPAAQKDSPDLIRDAKHHPIRETRENAIRRLVFDVVKNPDPHHAVFEGLDTSLIDIIGNGGYSGIKVPRYIRVEAGLWMVERLTEAGYWDILIRFGKFNSFPGPVAAALTKARLWGGSHYGARRSCSRTSSKE